MSLAQVGCLCLQAASAQTADPIEDATKAARPGVLLVRASVFGSADGGLCLLVQDEPLQKTALENEAPEQNRKQMCSANTVAKARESTPAPGRIWLRQNDSEMWP